MRTPYSQQAEMLVNRVLALILVQASLLLADPAAQLMDFHTRINSLEPDLVHCHVGMKSRSGQIIREAWIALDSNGHVSNIRVNVLDMEQSLVWTEDVCQMWNFKKNQCCLFRDQLYTAKMLLFADRHHPRLVYKHLHHLLIEKGVDVRFEDPNDGTQILKIIVDYPNDTYLIGKPKGRMRDLYYISSKTHRLSKTEVYYFVKERYAHAATWIYQDYAEPTDPNVFNLNHQLHSGVQVLNSLDIEYGIQKGTSSDEEVAIALAEEFLSAWKSQDMQTAQKLLGSVYSHKCDLPQLMKELPLMEVVGISQPNKRQPYLGLFISAAVKVRHEEDSRQRQIVFHTSPKHGDRWHIESYQIRQGEIQMN